MKRYLIFLLALVLSVGAVSASTAFDDALNELDSVVDFNVDYFTFDTNVTVGDYNFTVPAGFGEIKPLSVNTSSGFESENVMFFTNAFNEIIVISITSSDGINDTIYTYIPVEVSYENTTINGHNGVKWTDEAYAFFSYRINNDLIVLQAPNESYFEVMII